MRPWSFRPGSPSGKLHASDLGYDLTALFDIDAVTDTYVHERHLVGIVERGAFDDGAGKLHRFEIRHRRNGSGPAHLVIDGQYAREGLLGLELICNGPARGLGGEAERTLEGHFVYLDDYAVGGIREGLARDIPFVDVCFDAVDIVADAALVGDRESPALRSAQRLVVGLERQALARNVIKRAPEAAMRDFVRIQKLQGTRGGVARVGKRRLLLFQAFPVQTVEGLVGHQDLTTYLELRREVAVEFLGDIGYPPDIVGNIVAYDSVAARQGTEKLAVAILETNGGTVEFELTAICETRSKGLVRPLRKSLHLGYAVSIAEGEHGETVRIMGELTPDAGFGVLASTLRLQVAADALGGRVRHEELGKCFLEVLELVHEVVILVVADHGSVVHVVPAAVVPDDLPELFYPFFRCFFLHNAL